MSPEIVRPFFVIELEASASMKGGSGASGGSELLPGSVVHVPPQVPLTSLAKPLNAAGAGPSSSVLSFHHFAPQNVTCAPTTALLLPMTKFSDAAAGEASASAAPPVTAVSAIACIRRVVRRRRRVEQVLNILVTPIRSLEQRTVAACGRRAIGRSARSLDARARRRGASRGSTRARGSRRP